MCMQRLFACRWTVFSQNYGKSPCKLHGLFYFISNNIYKHHERIKISKNIRGLGPTHSKGSRINFGEGLGIDSDYSTNHLIPDFAACFQRLKTFFQALPNQKIHSEPGRSSVGQCGNHISCVLYVQEGKNNKFIVLSAGMNDLIRPALYPASHRTGEPDIERPPATIRGIFPVSTFPKHGGDNKDAAVSGRRLFPV